MSGWRCVKEAVASLRKEEESSTLEILVFVLRVDKLFASWKGHSEFWVEEVL